MLFSYYYRVVMLHFSDRWGTIHSMTKVMGFFYPYTPIIVNPVIEEVFANLLSNAIKYSPIEGKIIIDIIDEGEDWKVKVTDFGEGISDDDKPKLFERFKRVEKGAIKGTGLGLAIVKRLISLHGGTVGIEDNPAGQGSVFWVTMKKA